MVPVAVASDRRTFSGLGSAIVVKGGGKLGHVGDSIVGPRVFLGCLYCSAVSFAFTLLRDPY